MLLFLLFPLLILAQSIAAAARCNDLLQFLRFWSHCLLYHLARLQIVLNHARCSLKVDRVLVVVLCLLSSQSLALYRDLARVQVGDPRASVVPRRPELLVASRGLGLPSTVE